MPGEDDRSAEVKETEATKLPADGGQQSQQPAAAGTTVSSHINQHATQGDNRTAERRAEDDRRLSAEAAHAQALSTLTSTVIYLQHKLEAMEQRQLSSGPTSRTPLPSGRYSMLSTAAVHGTHNRPSFGVPTNPFTPTPVSHRRTTFDIDEDDSPQHDARRAGRRATLETEAEADVKEKKNVLGLMKGTVDPFYADKSKDNGLTVMDFVEKIESQMNDLLNHYPQHRLMVVRTFLKAGAMRWMNVKLSELRSKAIAEGRNLDEQPIEWDRDVRRLFIAAHVGTDTAEIWLSKLALLTLGSTETPTPIELDGQFDSIARHILPTESSADVGRDMLLCQYYGRIVFQYNDWVYKNILRAGLPASLAEWKLRLSQAVAAEEHIKAMNREAGGHQHKNGGKGSKGQGQTAAGRGGKAYDARKPAAHAAAAV